jgi:hypothetical protein
MCLFVIFFLRLGCYFFCCWAVILSFFFFSFSCLRALLLVLLGSADHSEGEKKKKKECLMFIDENDCLFHLYMLSALADLPARRFGDRQPLANRSNSRNFLHFPN